MQITEVVKNFLRQPENTQADKSSEVKNDNILTDLTNNDLYPNTGAFFDDDQYGSGLFGKSAISDIIQKQKLKIMKYRQLAMLPDASDAIDEIVNEVIFSFDDKIPLKINVDEENDKLVKAITDKFYKVVKITDLKRQLFNIVKRSYIDGQVILHCAYDKKNTKNGIQNVKMIEPCMLYFDTKENVYKYMTEENGLTGTSQQNQTAYSIEELIREDFGLYDGKINLGYLEYALKSANQLQTLEDLLIPLRFSRSISRRVFNVDIGDLPNKRGQEVMREHQSKFKYKKFYNSETGEVTNQQHITSMVEDYWFANRSGGKGTQVDLLDETGNLGELDDILYFARKLYRSLKIPSSRISINPDADQDFDYDTTRVTKEDMKFFMFISRIRQVYSSLFKEILKREVVSTGIMTEPEWEDKEDQIEISFSNENKFIEKMKIVNLQEQIEAYATVKEYAGSLMSHQRAMKEVFKWTDEEILENLKEIAEEKKDEKFAGFYDDPDGDGRW